MPIMPENPVHLPAEKLSVGCPVLDRFLGGGIPFGFVTELAGEASSGKTQLCLQIVLSAASPRSCTPSASLFISTEPPFPLRRLLSLSSDTAPLDHIFVRSAFSSKELFGLLNHVDKLLSLVRLSSGRRVRILVLDSAAAVFHTDAEDAVRRSPELFTVAAKLKEQARRFNLAVIVTNHVVDVVDGGFSDLRVGNYLSLSSSGRKVCPAMGLAWSNCVNMRLFLSRSPEDGNGDTDGCANLQRKLQVVFAPHLPEGSCEFVIRREGVFGVGTQALIPTSLQ
ncbi:DNA repair protein XRCC3 homolog [Phalaenopsis equestris]|uniref:DNA repair protein XRCC3 homolog n=1 Tax=Phalaenopsis equestris TaxID=78828 RepID=UPI0009E3ADE9|nr:DNA repair protein XRCC3 homolog [Phalaenopsis equestris]